MSETLTLGEHELRSLRRWLNQMYPNRDIYISRPTVEFARPALTLTETVPRSAEDAGTGFGVFTSSGWQIEVLAEREDPPLNGFWTARREVAEISQRLLTVRRVPLYLWSWKYPPAVLEVLPGAGSLSAGELSVIVTAVNAEGEESLGEEVTVEVAAGDAVRVWISPWPRQSTVAERYRVYAGASGSELQEAEVVADLSSPLAVAHDLEVLVGTGDQYDATGSVFFYRHMCVDRDSVTTEVLEHPDTDGIFNGFVRFGTTILSQRATPFSRPVEDISISDLEVV